MTLRKKALLAGVLLLAALVAVLSLTCSTVLMKRFAALEREATLENLGRVKNLLLSEAAALKTSAADYSCWDDTCRYVQDRNPEFVASNFINETFSNLDLDFIVLLNLNGDVLYSGAFDRKQGGRKPLDPEVLAAVYGNPPCARPASPESGVTGFLVSGKRLLLVASSPIITSEHKGPVRGALIFGREIGPERIAKLSALAKHNLDIRLKEASPPDEGFREASDALSEGEREGVSIRDEDTVEGYSLLDDLNGKPGALLRVTLPRPLHREAHSTVLLVIASILLVAVAFGFTSIGLLETGILQRLGKLKSEVSAVRAGDDISGRVSCEGADELTEVSSSVNRMLESLEAYDRDLRKARDELESRVRERTAELRASEERLKTITENAPDVIQQLDAEGRVVFVNRPVPGFSLGETLGRSFVEFLPPDHHDRFMSVLGQVFNGGRSVEYETPAFGPAGHLRWYHIRLSPVFVSEITENAILFATDITARKQAEEERRKLEARIRHAQKLESLVSMAGGISHDFNNLLAIILGNAELALSETPHGSPVRENLENIGKAVDRSVRLTKQMLAYSGKSVFAVEPLHLASVVQNSLETVENSISPHCALKMQVDEDIPLITGDATQLSQVLGNLMVNASESIGEQTGVISLSVTTRWCDQQWLAEHFPLAPLPEGLYACIEVADTGCGIPSEAKDRIFEPFYSTKFTGRGLGLSTAQGIVRCHGGDIRAVSAPERGTIFQVLLPIA